MKTETGDLWLIRRLRKEQMELRARVDLLETQLAEANAELSKSQKPAKLCCHHFKGVFIPGCMGAAVYGRIGCTCESKTRKPRRKNHL